MKHCKVPDIIAKEIYLKRHRDGYACKELAALFDLSDWTVTQICNLRGRFEELKRYKDVFLIWYDKHKLSNVKVHPKNYEQWLEIIKTMYGGNE